MDVVRSSSFTAPLLALALALALGGCGTSEGGDYGGKHPDYARALAGAPAPLASLYRQGDRLLHGGESEYRARIAALRGYPVVVNVWASWCGDCRFEFPMFQRLAARLGKRVAFMGIDSADSDDAARTFLGEEPLPYPSFTDPGNSLAESLGVSHGLPDTAFYDRRGKLLYLKQGVYRNAAELTADIRRFALEGRESG